MGIVSAVQHIEGVPDLPFAGEEHEDVAVFVKFGQSLHGACDRFGKIVVVLLPAFLPDVFDGEEFAFHFHNGGSVKKVRDPFRFQRGGGDDDPQVPALFEEQFQVTEEKIDIEAAFVDFVQNNAVVLQQQGIGAGFRQKDPIRHELDHGVFRGVIVKPDFVPHFAAVCHAGFRREPGGERCRRQTPRLGTADPARPSEAFQQCRFRQLGRLAGAGGPADDDHLIFFQCRPDGRDLFRDGQIFRKGAGQFLCVVVQGGFFRSGQFLQQRSCQFFRHCRIIGCGGKVCFVTGREPPPLIQADLPPEGADLFVILIFCNGFFHGG